MSKTFLTLLHLLILICLVFGQSQLGFEQYSAEEKDGDDPNKNDPSSFTAVSSLFYQPGTAYKVFFSANPHWKNEPLQLKCILMANSDNSTTIESHNITLCPGQSGQISIPLPREMPRGETVWRLFAWSFTETDLPNEYIHQAPHTLIYSKLGNAHQQSLRKVNLASVFIQTDKPVYKPGDLIRIRVITMGTDDLPHLTSGVNMTITDSQGNLMKKWQQPLELPESASVPANVSSVENVGLFGEFQKKRNGLSAYEYQLSGEPILGNWTIQVEAGNIKERMHFDVQKYILPKFQVKVKVPPFLYGTGVISTSASIKVSYTYGKELHGAGTVTVSSSNDARTKLQQLVVKDGEAIVPITLRASHANYTVHTITANVTEENTGRWEIGKATVRIYPQETYTIQWINQPASYNPGLPITVQLKITGQDGFPVKDGRVNSLRLIFPSSLNLPAREISILPSGIVFFSFPTPPQPIPANSKLGVQYKKYMYDFILPAAAAGTSSGIFIEVVSPPDSVHLAQGQSYNFTIRSNKPIQPDVFRCLLWDDAGMEVHGAQTLVNNQSEPATEFPFSLQLPKAAYTDLKIFVYFETEEDETKQVISTFKSINTHNYLKIRVTRPLSTKTPEINNLIGITGTSSTAAPSPDVLLETITTSAPTTTTTSTTTTKTPITTTTTSWNTTAQPATEYEYDDYEYPSDGSAAADRQPQLGDKVEVEPGAAVEIHFETSPDSTIAIRGVDQSLLLLTEQDNDLNQETVQSKRASSQLRQSQLDNISTDNFTFLRTFHRLGISVLDSQRFTAFVKLVATCFGCNPDEEADVVPPPVENPDIGDSRIPQVDSRLRTNFPETWLWEEFESSNDSSTTVLHKILPDTLTSWIISGFSLNPTTGLAVASPVTITGFMPFFVTLNFPYSVFKYESFDLQVIVHNYLDRDVNVWVTLFNRQNYFNFIDSREILSGVGNRYIKVAKDHVAVARFVIMPTLIGEIPIEVKVVTEDGAAGDSMLRPLKVKPDGVRQSRSQLVILSRPRAANANMARNKTLKVQFPTKVVKGANSIQLTVIGDPIGTMTSNLDHLLKLPGGCGEQNMGKFVPNILALHYLSATASDAKTVMKVARTNLDKGYSHQLQYKQKDGSFSIWAHGKGLTWLTAYVLKWFVVAQQYITIDDKVIKGAINFIRSKQQRNGSFVETGVFYHPEMRGHDGANGVALTAYITLALIKANETSKGDLDLKVTIENGMRFISRRSVYELDDNYITNLVAATLMAGNHPEKTRFFEKMEKRAKMTTTREGVNLKFWNMINEREGANDALTIEMTSYALLAHIWKQEKKDNSVITIYRWLLNQRNPQGGFISTQDTVMALSALTEFALKTIANVRKEDELQLNIRASSNSLTLTERTVSVSHWNRMVLQEFKLPVSTKAVDVEARGRGPALIQLTESWYVPIRSRPPRRPEDDFNITANMRIPDPEEPSETELTLCVHSYHLNGAMDSIASIELPSGYAFDREAFEEGSDLFAEKPRNVQRFELTEGNSKVDIYYSYIQAYPPTCLTLAATQLIEVADAKNPPIHVYEYLNPEVKGANTYVPAHRTNVCQLCARTGACDREKCP